MAFFVLVVALFVAIGLLVGSRGLAGLVALQLGAILFPSLAFAWWVRFSWWDDLHLGPPEPRALLGAALTGTGTWFVLISTVLWVQNQFIQPSEAFLAQRNALFMSASAPGEWAFVWLAAALVPALAEEFFFRGVLLASLRGWLGDRRAVVAVAALFAFFHMNVYQLVVTFLLGIILGWLVVRTGSLWTSMVFHLVNNSVILVAANVEGETLPLTVVGLLVGLLVVGAILLIRFVPRGADPARVVVGSGSLLETSAHSVTAPSGGAETE